MSARMVLKIKLGPLVHFEITGDNCGEISEALKGYQELNEQLDALCSDLAARVYPEGYELTEHEATGGDHDL